MTDTPLLRAGDGRRLLALALMKMAHQCSISKSDGEYLINLLDRFQEEFHTQQMRVEFACRLCRSGKFLWMIALAVACLWAGAATAETGLPGESRTTFIVFAEYPVHDGEWTELFDAFSKSLNSAAADTPALGVDFDLIRGDQFKRGTQVNKPVSVYLHGDCTLQPMPRSATIGRLGWVTRLHGQIEPFIHVECGQIAQMLGPFALGMNRDRRNTVMGEAVARVILHEWVHVATQNATHERDGVSKSHFGVADLLADDVEVRRDPRFPRNPRSGQ